MSDSQLSHSDIKLSQSDSQLSHSDSHQMVTILNQRGDF